MTILDDILATKRGEVATRRATVSLADLQERAGLQTPPRGFAAALTVSGGLALVAAVVAYKLLSQPMRNA